MPVKSWLPGLNLEGSNLTEQERFNREMAEYQVAQEWAMMRESNAAQAAQAEAANAFTKEMWGMTANFNAQQQAKAMEYNSAEAERLRQWQENMSNTSYQRAVADLEKAGLNPILAALNGGANTPTGSMGSIGGASMNTISGQQAAMQMGHAGMASSSGYHGILENISNGLGLFGAIAQGLATATGASEAAAKTAADKALETISPEMSEKARDIVEEIAGKNEKKKILPPLSKENKDILHTLMFTAMLAGGIKGGGSSARGAGGRSNVINFTDKASGF